MKGAINLNSNDNKEKLLKDSPEYEDYSENYLIEENQNKCTHKELNKNCNCSCSKNSKTNCQSHNCSCPKKNSR